MSKERGKEVRGSSMLSFREDLMVTGKWLLCTARKHSVEGKGYGRVGGGGGRS